MCDRKRPYPFRGVGMPSHTSYWDRNTFSM